VPGRICLSACRCASLCTFIRSGRVASRRGITACVAPALRVVELHHPVFGFAKRHLRGRCRLNRKNFILRNLRPRARAEGRTRLGCGLSFRSPRNGAQQNRVAIAVSVCPCAVDRAESAGFSQQDESLQAILKVISQDAECRHFVKDMSADLIARPTAREKAETGPAVWC